MELEVGPAVGGIVGLAAGRKLVAVGLGPTAAGEVTARARGPLTGRQAAASRNITSMAAASFRLLRCVVRVLPFIPIIDKSILRCL